MSRRVALVMGAFHREKVEKMVVSARAAAGEAGLEIVDEVWVHGSIETPLALKRLLLRDDVDGAVTLGIIERGETKHGLVMGQAVVGAIIQLQLELMKPITLGILGPEILPSQIPSRLESYAREAVIAVTGMLD